MNDELKYSSTSPFLDLNDQTFLNWDFSQHPDPTGAEQGGQNSLYTAGDLAAAMSLNPYLKVFCANGYFDAVTPFFQTVLNLDTMPLVDAQARRNLTIKNYPSGHMIYLDNESRRAMKRDLAEFYHSTRAELLAAAAQPRRSHGLRRIGRTPY